MPALGETLLVLAAAYPRHPMSESALRVYAQDLSDMDETLVWEACVRLRRTETILPSIAQIRLEVAQALTALPSAEVAWDMATTGDPNMPTEVRLPLAAAGGRWTLTHSENPTTVRAQFVRDYESRRLLSLKAAAGGAVMPHLLPPGADVVSLNERRFLEIPETTRVRPRPVMARLALRFAGRVVPPPSEEDKQDAIQILREGESVDQDPLYREAELVMILSTNEG